MSETLANVLAKIVIKTDAVALQRLRLNGTLSLREKKREDVDLARGLIATLTVRLADRGLAPRERATAELKMTATLDRKSTIQQELRDLEEERCLDQAAIAQTERDLSSLRQDRRRLWRPHDCTM